MASLSLGSLPLGYRFRPTDTELVDHYLRLKINGDDKNTRVIREIDVCKHEPWDLAGLSAIPTKDPEWFFLCPRDIKHPSGNRLNRATQAGYWKATGKDRKIKLNGKLIGMKKTLVFYLGRAPMGKRTHWVVHEYRTTLEELNGTHPGQSAFVLCRLFNKQDETIEDSNVDDSPAAVKFSPAGVESELEMPQDSPSPALLEGPSADHETKHRVINLPANEVSLQQGNDSTFDYPLMNPLSLPLPLEIKEEMCPSGHDQFKCSQLSVAVSDGTPVCEQFHPMDFSLAEEGSLGMFGNQAIDFGCLEAQLLEHDMKDSNFSSIVGGISEEAPSCQPDSESPTGIRIMPRPNFEVTSLNVAAQGDALRRMRVQRRLQMGPTVCQVYTGVSEESKTLDIEETKVSEEEQSKVAAPGSIEGGGCSSLENTLITQWKGLLPMRTFINLFRFFTLLVLFLSLIGSLFWSSSSSSSQY